MKTYQNKHLTVEVACSRHVLRQTWIGLPTGEDFRTGSLTTLALAQRHHVKRWLIDLRLLRLFNPIDLQWFTGRWLPEAVHQLPTSVRVAIVVTDLHQFGKVGSDLVLRACLIANPALVSRYFLDKEDASEWLVSDR